MRERHTQRTQLVLQAPYLSVRVRLQLIKCLCSRREAVLRVLVRLPLLRHPLRQVSNDLLQAMDGVAVMAALLMKARVLFFALVQLL